MIYSRVLGTGSFLPQKTLSNQDLEKIVETTDEWITKRVGIKIRHLVDNDENTTDMAVAAAQKAIKMAGIQANDIDLIIVATATQEYYFPSTACLVQEQLKVNREIPAFDLNAACAGFIYGISVADQYIRGGIAKTVLVVGAEALSKLVDWTDRGTCILFGDGAGALVLGASEQPGIRKTILHSNGKHSQLINSKNVPWSSKPEDSLIKMRGNEVFKIAVNKLGGIVDETLSACGIEKSDIDWLIPHQANTRIIQATAKKLDLPLERVILTIEEHGNTSAASIPLAFDNAIRSGKIKRGESLLLIAFGAGLAWGSAHLIY